jgi:hypothetical protein
MWMEKASCVIQQILDPKTEQHEHRKQLRIGKPRPLAS